MAQLAVDKLTLEKFLKLPETKPASEYIDGRIIQKLIPQGKHNKLQGRLVTAIDAIVEPQRIALAFPKLRCTFGDRSIVLDVSVFAWDRIPVDENGDVANVFQLAPNWTIEILSPEQSQTKVTGNILHCLSHGSQMGWLVDPDERSLLVYPLGQQPQLLQAPTQVLAVPSLVADVGITADELFRCLRLPTGELRF